MSPQSMTSVLLIQWWKLRVNTVWEPIGEKQLCNYIKFRDGHDFKITEYAVAEQI